MHAKAAATDAATESPKLGALEDVRFDNRVLRELPTEPLPENPMDNAKPRPMVRGFCFSRVPIQPLPNPRVVAASPDALALCGISSDQVSRPEFAEVFSGSKHLQGSTPAAHCYCGFQFGNFAGQLGDGAAMYLGEAVRSDGERWEMQLKGAGMTPYSRAADGRKVLRSSLREFLCSEAMHGLGIPTTRAGCVVVSDATVVRDVFYNGNAQREPCAVVLRIAQTFLRFGSFEIFRKTDPLTQRQGPSHGLEQDMMPPMLDFATFAYFPEVFATFCGDVGIGADVPREEQYARVKALPTDAKREMYKGLVREVCLRTARLVAGWQAVGFCHGVLNTDNMSLTGVTIDYGPYGFLDRYDPAHICNWSDDGGRYDYRSQPRRCSENLLKLVDALKPVVGALDSQVSAFTQEYDREYLRRMREKLGLVSESAEVELREADSKLIERLFTTMEATGADFTNAFRALMLVPTPKNDGGAANGNGGGGGAGGVPAGCEAALDALMATRLSLQDLIAATQPRIPEKNLQMVLMAVQRDPNILFQLGISKETLEAEMNKHERVRELEATKAEDRDQADRALWSAWLREYWTRLEKEAGVGGTTHEERYEAMRGANPRVVLRNHLAQHAIDAAERGDFSEAQRLFEVLRNPYADPAGPEGETTVDGSLRYDMPPPPEVEKKCVSCSS
ncbi:unnamed protein product [Pedinophyceae sp. YPF-701]|nr:unnamed protein product [Pedinophyceae sp. YPF-701]